MSYACLHAARLHVLRRNWSSISLFFVVIWAGGTAAFAAANRGDVTLAEGCLTCPKSQARNRRAKLPAGALCLQEGRGIRFVELVFEPKIACRVKRRVR